MQCRVFSYDTDVGKHYYFPALSLNFVAMVATPVGGDPVLSDVVPPVLLAACSDVKLGVCSLPKGVSPRFVRAFLASGNHYRIEYPFRPNSPDWMTFWSQLQGNSNVVSVEGVGEVMGDRSLRLLL